MQKLQKCRKRRTPENQQKCTTLVQGKFGDFSPMYVQNLGKIGISFDRMHLQNMGDFVRWDQVQVAIWGKFVPNSAAQGALYGPVCFVVMILTVLVW